MKHKKFITLPYSFERPTPGFEEESLRFPEGLVRYFLKTYTKKGQNIFDPFAGLGTSLFVAEEMGRTPFGIEAERERFEWTAGQVEHWQNVFHADAGLLDKLPLPKMDFCITSPPQMAKNQKWNPLFSGDPKKAGYDVYLRRMRFIFKKITAQMKHGAYIFVQIDNIDSRPFTPLIHDIVNALSPFLSMDGEIVVQWDKPKNDYTHTHCLIFKKT